MNKEQIESFITIFHTALHNKELDNYLIYSDDFIAWAKSKGYKKIAKLAKEHKLQYRSYPHEILNWVEETMVYLYDDSIPKADASKKEIPDFLLK